jgi:hypothetical protein
MATIHEVLQAHLNDWLKAKGDRKRRSKIAQVVCEAIRIHPKSISRAFRRLQMKDGARGERRGRPKMYGPDVTAALKEMWVIAGEACAENLHPLMVEYVEILRRDGMWHHSSHATAGVLAMSLGTMKKRLSKFRRMLFLSHGKSTTSPSSIHSMVPVRSGPWDKAPVGTMQIDTVAHCGNSTAGDYVFTVNSTDVSTLWSTRRAQWNKGQEATVHSMEEIDADVPFPVHEWHPDSGSEFVNWHCLAWSQGRGQNLTRSRPNHKNDNCFVEERNGHVVRRWVGYARFDTQDLVDALNAVYDTLTLYLNHFIASRRTTSKERIGARWKVTREKRAGTPYQRVLLREDVSDEVKTRLKREHETLNPLVLKKEIDQKLKHLFAIQKRHESPFP